MPITGGITGVRLPVDDENSEEPWKMPPSRRRSDQSISETLPTSVNLVMADQVYVDRSALPPIMVLNLYGWPLSRDPEFYRAQAMRLPTFGKPRIISCAELHPRHVGLPRGCLDEVRQLLTSHGVEVRLTDSRASGTRIQVEFQGTLHKEQAAAVAGLSHSSLAYWPRRQHLARPLSARK